MNLSSRMLYLLVGFIVLLCVILGAFYFFLQGKSSSTSTMQEVLPTVQSILAGDKQTAHQQAGEFLVSHSATDDAATALAQRIYASSAFSMATTSEGRAAAVNLMMQGYESATAPDARALMINLIAVELLLNPQLPSSSNSNNLYQVVFGPGPFQSLGVSGANGKSLQNLLAYALTIYPVDQLYYLRAVVAARATEQTILSGSSSPAVLQGAKTDAQRIASYIQAGDTIDQQSIVSSGNTGIDAWTKAQNSLFRGLGFSGAAFVDPSMLPKATAAFQDVITDAQTASASNQSSAALNLQAAYAHLYAARILNIVGGASHASDVRTHLTAFVETVTAAPQNYVDVYSMFAWIKNATNIAPSERAGNRQYQLFTTYKDLAKISPEFKSFLVSQGWSL